MKTFQNLETEFTDEKEVKLCYAYLAIQCLNSVPQGGISPVEMEGRVSVIKLLKNAEPKAKIEIEDAPFNILLKCVENMKWALIHEDIVQFNKYIKSLSIEG